MTVIERLEIIADAAWHSTTETAPALLAAVALLVLFALARRIAR